jgi:predicted metal-dependent hydrolase
MNAHSTMEPDQETPAITVRDLRFNRDARPSRWWLNGDPVATAWHNALSLTFPRGEAFFIESVKACREGTPPELEAEIRAFVRQEVNHSREHLAFNRAVTDAGYDVSRIDAHVSEMLDMTKGRPAVVNLAATMALEHFTAIMAHEFLTQPRHFKGSEPQAEAMWRWHAIEEIEHKAVAYDTYLHATKGWKRRKRWMLKAVMMVVITKNFIPHRIRDTLDLLEQDGLKGWKVKARVLWYLFGTPGVLRRLIPAWIAYFLPGFHPWDQDDRHLIAKAEAGLAAQPA